MEYLFSFDRIVNMKTFIEAVKNCEHEVFFESREGDKLALHSTLCQFILYSICEHPPLTKDAVIRCIGEHDAQILKPHFH